MEALQFMVNFFQTIGWSEDIVEYDDQVREVHCYKQREIALRR